MWEVLVWKWDGRMIYRLLGRFASGMFFFQDFWILDHIHDHPSEADDVDLTKLETAVDEFAAAMCQHHDSEKRRREDTITALNTIFSCYLPFPFAETIAGSIGMDMHTDGHAHGPAPKMETIVQGRHELWSEGADPEVRLASNYYPDSGPHKNLYDKSLFPALGIWIISISWRTA